jgi:hypothetical protein
MPAKQNDIGVTREEFIAALKKARERAGSSYKLAVALTAKLVDDGIEVQQRRVMYWFKGQGPTNKTMPKIYEKLKEI